MNPAVTSGAILVSQRRLVVEVGRVRRANLVCVAVTFETELPDRRTRQQFRVRRAVWRVTRRTTFDLQWRVLEDKRPLLIRVTLQTTGVGTRRQTSLLQLEAAVRIVTVTTFDETFEDLVMKRPAELRLRLAVTTDAELRFAAAQHVRCDHIAVSSLCF